MFSLEQSSEDIEPQAESAKSISDDAQISGAIFVRRAEEQSRLAADFLARQTQSENHFLAKESRFLVDYDFVHSEFTRHLCPEVVGHFCMLWGDHGQGGYDTLANGYIQGGQPMGDTFDLTSIYLDFEEALGQRNWVQMRQSVRELRQLRTDMGYSQAEEREARRDGDF